MPIYQALQLAYRAAQFKARSFDRRHSSDQILGRHLVDILRREQAQLRAASSLDQASESSRRPSSDSLQVGFRYRSFLLG